MLSAMRPSPLAHPLAVLRTMIGLTQKQMGALVNRAARTIQSIELGKLPLTEELALRIAEATGVDEAWLFAGNPATPPVRGLTLRQAGRGPGVYTKEDYENHRAYLETPLFEKEDTAAAPPKTQAKGAKPSAQTMRKFQKSDVLMQRKELVSLIDADLVSYLQFILLYTQLTDDMRLVRWKLRRCLEDIAREFSLVIPTTGISIKTLELANPMPKVELEAAQFASHPPRKSKA
jgi:transcriptional regulator with XRE-family HTH domain